jgi:hypothetical protein
MSSIAINVKATSASTLSIAIDATDAAKTLTIIAYGLTIA